MGKNILKVDPVAFGYDDFEFEKDDSYEENDFEWDQKDLNGAALARVLSDDVVKEPELTLDEFPEDDEF
ncbi:hypothetical protein [Marinilabilia sp.]|jgi:hypothetical protein